jgi:MerR family transcriptional regulator, copper efflux regulator
VCLCSRSGRIAKRGEGHSKRLRKDKSRASADVKRLALDHIAEIRAKIAAMSAMRDTVQELADACDGDERSECPILRDLEDAAVGHGG